MEEGEGRRKPWAYSSVPSTFCICFPLKSGNCCLVCILEGKECKTENSSSSEEAPDLALTCKVLGCTNLHQEGSGESPACQIEYSLSWREGKGKIRA